MRARVTDAADYPAAARAAWSEARFLREVIALAKANGWRTAHFLPSTNRRGHWRTAVQGDGRGFPDLVMLRGSVLVVAELKVKDGRLSEHQKAWMSALLSLPAVSHVKVWYPDDWSEIERVLTGEV